MKGTARRSLAGLALILASAVWPVRAEATVTVVSDGSDGAPARILVHSAIRRGDAAAFKAAVRRIRRVDGPRINGIPFVTVALDSPGGDVVEAVEIGRTIYENFMMTLIRPGRECVSACVFILAAGAVRTPADQASIGVHRPLLVSWSNMSSAEAHAKYDDLMAYLRTYFIRLGVSPKAYEIMMGTANSGMRYFSPAELDRLGLRGEDPAWERLYALRWATWRAEARPWRRSDAVPAHLAAPDPSWRDIVFMPGAYHPGSDYLAGVRLPRVHFTWQTIDGDEIARQPPPTLAELWAAMARIAAKIARSLEPCALLIGLAAFEILRNRRQRRER